MTSSGSWSSLTHEPHARDTPRNAPRAARCSSWTDVTRIARGTARRALPPPYPGPGAGVRKCLPELFADVVTVLQPGKQAGEDDRHEADAGHPPHQEDGNLLVSHDAESAVPGVRVHQGLAGVAERVGGDPR